MSEQQQLNPAEENNGKIEKTIVIDAAAAGFAPGRKPAGPAPETADTDTTVIDAGGNTGGPAGTGGEAGEIFDTIAALDGLDRHFVKIRDFAAGGQGVLSQGVEQTLQRRIAIKTLRQELAADPKQCRDFLEEARITARLEHPAIVPIHSVHHYEGQQPAVMMKLIDGENFRTYLLRTIENYRNRPGKIKAAEEAAALRERLEIFLKVCDALDYAHQQNVMHCDLKPENFMIGKYHDTYLMDWGIARPILSKEYNPATWTPRPKISGTLRYIAPETVRGEYSNQRADIYAMGLILFEIAALHPAIPDGTQAEMIDAVKKHRLTPLKHQFGCPIDRDLQAVIRKASAFHPEDRYGHIEELAEDVRRVLRRDEVAANPDNFLQKIFRSCIVHHGKAMLILTLCCLLGAAGFAAFALSYQLQRESKSKLRGNTIEYALVEGMKIAAMMDAEMTGVESNLIACSRELAYLLDGRLRITGAGGQIQPAVNAQEYTAHPESISSYRFYPGYRGKYDFDHTGYLVFPDTPPARRPALTAIAGAMQRPMQDVLLNSQFQKRLTLDTREELRQSLLNNDVSVNLVYFAFDEGFYFCYPGKSYKSGYDPRRRQWYQTRINPAAPAAGWSTPYLNYGETGLVMTYSLRMGGGGRKPFGVAALDYDITKLTEFIRNYGRQAEASGYGLLEFAVVDDHGNAIATSDGRRQAAVTEHYRRSRTGGTEGYCYLDSRLLRLMQSDKSEGGYWETKENGRSVIYVYARCRTLNWFFVGKLDLQKCMEYLKKTNDEV